MTKLKIFCGTAFLIILAVFLFVLPPSITGQTPSPVTNCGGGTQARAEGLVTTSSLQGKFGTTGKCVVDQKTAFVPYKIPTYDDLKSLYFTQAKAPKITTLTSISSSTNFGTSNTLYYVSGNLTVSGNPSGTGTQVIFVEGDLSFSSTGNYCYGTTCPSGTVSGTVGTVFVVKGAVNIDPAVTRIDAVIISEGVICTAFDAGFCPFANIIAPQLFINGSLISLNDSVPIKFRRTLSGVGNNATPAEKIIHQPKYPVILRDLFSNTLQKWSEIQ